MDSGTSVVDWLVLLLARLLATKPAMPVLVTGILALATIGAIAITPTAQHQIPPAIVATTQLPAYLQNSCKMLQDGAIICHWPASVVEEFPTAPCSPQNWQGNTMYTCYYPGN
jgi:hypothetical protein